MNERDIDRHSVGCALCGELADERECLSWINDEGSVCRPCAAKAEAATKMYDALQNLLSLGDCGQSTSDFMGGIDWKEIRAAVAAAAEKGS